MSINCRRYLLIAAAALAMTTTSAFAEKITFVFSTPWSLDSAQYVFAQELGYFAEEGIEPEYVITQGSLAAVQQILGGSGDAGYLSPDVIALSLQEGKTPIPMTLVYNYYRRTVWETTVPAKSDIKTFADLKGKTIGVAALTSGGVPLATAALASIGVGKGEYSYLPVGVGAQAFQALTSRTVDALNLWNVMNKMLEQSGVPIRYIAYPGDFASIPGSSVVFRNDYIKNKPQMVEKFGRALTKGTIACAANREACVHALWKVHPNLKPASLSDKDAMAQALPIVDVSLNRIVLNPDESDQRWGSFVAGSVQLLLDAVKTGGLISNSNIPLNKIYTNDFVDAFNKIDRKKVEADAKVAK